METRADAVVQPTKGKILTGLVIVLVLWIVLGLVPAALPGQGWPSTPGEVGDMFGAVNALFSGLALAGVVWALLQTQNSLTLQLEELRETRREMSLQVEHLEAQAKAGTSQQAMTGFFQVLGELDETIGVATKKRGAHGSSSRSLVDEACFRMRERYGQQVFTLDGAPEFYEIGVEPWWNAEPEIHLLMAQVHLALTLPDGIAVGGDLYQVLVRQRMSESIAWLYLFWCGFYRPDVDVRGHWEGNNLRDAFPRDEMTSYDVRAAMGAIENWRRQTAVAQG
jgi:hypothetical protein